jgi:hypothetical protein
MAPKKALLTLLWSPKWGLTSFNNVKVNGLPPVILLAQLPAHNKQTDMYRCTDFNFRGIYPFFIPLTNFVSYRHRLRERDRSGRCEFQFIPP